MADTNLAQAVEAANAASSYDTNIKFLLADRQILARVLKYAVSEFKDMSVGDIMSSIGGDIEIGTKPLDAGLSNLAKLGYHLENRILFYLARMVSAQKQTEFYHSDYDSLKPVRSIWLCLDNGRDGDSIEEISLRRGTVFGNGGAPCDMGLMRGIIVNVRSGENKKDSQNILISMLEKLLSKADVEEKKRILTEEYGMVMTTELEGRMQTMCNWSEAIKEVSFEEGKKEGKEEGKEEGKKEGIKAERLGAIGRMVKAGATKEQIISFGYTEGELAEADSLLCTDV